MTEHLPQDSTGQASSRVLLVEDDADLCGFLTLVLQAHGFAVSSAANGREALTFLHENPRPNVILLDLMMPVMSGWQFRREQQHDPELSPIPVVVLSGVANVEDEASALAAASCLRKPIDAEVLVATVRRHAAWVPDRGPP